MIFEALSTAAMAGLAGYAYLRTKGMSSDTDKIQMIFKNAGWQGRGGETIRLQRKRKINGGTEYVYQLPLGFNRKTIEENKHILEDGLNVRSKVDFQLSDLKELKLDRTIVHQIQKVLKGKRTRKEIDIVFDGMLKIRVYNNPFANGFEWEESLLKEGWKVVIGQSREKVIYHDFESNYFMIVAGAAGFGKSQFLKMVITTLALQQPENVHFHLIDLKGGLSFSRFKNLKQVDNFGKDQSDALSILNQVQVLMNTRHEYLEKKGFEDAKEAKMKDRHFVVIDEAADLTSDCQDIVEDIARRGRACGIRMLYATQYPTNETLRSQVRQNALARVCFKLKTNIASRAVLDEGGAELLPEIPGRAIYQTTSNEIVQTAYISNERIKKLITPYIISKKGDSHEQDASSKATTDRKHTLIIEEDGLSD